MAKVDFQTHCRRITSRFRRQSPSRTPSLLITLFGDVVEAHGGEISLGSLIRLAIPLGANERLVRTSVYRLAQDDWVSGTRQGRRSYYRLTTSGQRIGMVTGVCCSPAPRVSTRNSVQNCAGA